MAELKHFGVIGMKWGVRKAQKALTRTYKKQHKYKNNKSKFELSNRQRNTLNILGVIGGMRLSSRYISKMIANGKIDTLSILGTIGSVSYTAGMINELNK